MMFKWVLFNDFDWMLLSSLKTNFSRFEDFCLLGLMINSCTPVIGGKDSVVALMKACGPSSGKPLNDRAI